MARFFLLLLLLPFLAGAQQPKAPVPDYRRTGAPLPPVKVMNEQGAVITNANIKPGKPVLVMIFSPECDHCLHFLDSLKGLTPVLGRYQTLLVTEKRHSEEFKQWRSRKGAGIGSLFRYSGWDAGNLIYFIYTYKLLPQVNIYNSRQQLVQSFAGEFPMDSLRMYLK